MSPSEDGGRRRVRSEDGESESQEFGTASKVMESRPVRSDATEVEERREEKEVRFWKEERMVVMLRAVVVMVEEEEDRRSK